MSHTERVSASSNTVTVRPLTGGWLAIPAHTEARTWWVAVRAQLLATSSGPSPRPLLLTARLASSAASLQQPSRHKAARSSGKGTWLGALTAHTTHNIATGHTAYTKRSRSCFHTKR